MSVLSLADVYRARRRIEGRVYRTPLIESPSLSAIAGMPVFLKLETVQPTGSFKLRGASNALAQLAEQGCRKVVTASTGNHGRAVAHAARALGIEATVCMSALVPENKVEAVRALGAHVRIAGKSQDDAEHEALRLVREESFAYVPPFDDLNVIAGQATIGLEIVEALPDVAHIVVPLSGGGLFAGVAFAAKSTDSAIRMSGVTMARGAAMHASLAAGRPVLVDEVETLADSLGGGIGLENRYTYQLTRDFIDHTVLLDEASIARGIVHAYEQERLVVEGAAAVGIAALLDGRLRDSRVQRGPLVLIVTGSNIDINLHRRIVSAMPAQSHSYQTP
ncbi:hydroxyectoine utilization dehydratase EutB [Paraburkholderia rhynchosiae]|uniref:Hydroxyectoine utilization dehydratase EutB n=1 Tax=Paraburkholderia rhynchosiae TaxID=487049 RepID=A0A2N7WAA4_9BURK|nr:hydroxyectoine utilization dehydratase EutB [Paraburkholderia rhynchosiae]PMS26343.1 hydroxyectoine utilization dehydratase EutB [Paraburkholderia rhynchosiae]CAB3729373.1 L-threonine ammonia-lyase [Paraburkholderia rhynchosiae]